MNLYIDFYFSLLNQFHLGLTLMLQLKLCFGFEFCVFVAWFYILAIDSLELRVYLRI
jgi:hypothetical protein